MAAKDTTKIVLAGTAVCGILLLAYFYKKKSKQQGRNDSKPKTDSKSAEKQVEQPKPVEASSQPLPTPSPVEPTKSPTPKPTESKIPQKIQSRAQNVKSPTTEKVKVPASTVPDKQGGGDLAEPKPKTTIVQQEAPPKSAPVPDGPKPQPVEPVAASPISQPTASESSSNDVIKSEASIILTPKPQDQEQSTPPSKKDPTPPKTDPTPPPPPKTDPPTPTPAKRDPTPPPPSKKDPTPPPKTDLAPTLASRTEAAPEQAPTQNGTQATDIKPVHDVEKITNAILQAKDSPSNVDQGTVTTLVSLLRQKDPELLQAALDSIVKLAAFTQNQSLLRESGCIQELTILLEVHAVAARTGVKSSENLLGSINNVIINLCMDIQNQARLEVCIPVLIDLITYEKSPDNVQLMSLKSLTNLSTTPSYHEQYIPAIPRLYAMMDGNSSSIRLQAVKVLVNLSCNPEIIPDLLEAKTPKTLLQCLEPHTDSILLLRVVTLLVNTMSGVMEGKIEKSKLPTEQSANPESMYMAMFSPANTSTVKSKVTGLTKHQTENVSKQAIRLLGYFK